MSVRGKLPSPADWGAERLYTQAEAAEVLGISQGTLTPPRMRVSTIDWNRPYEGKESS